MSKLTLSYKLKGNTFSKFKIIFPSLPQTFNFLLTLNYSYRVSAYKKKRKKKVFQKIVNYQAGSSVLVLFCSIWFL